VNDNSINGQGESNSSSMISTIEAKRNERKQTAAPGIPKGFGNPLVPQATRGQMSSFPRVCCARRCPHLQ